MRYAPRAILAGGLGFAVSFVVACGGGSGLLSGNQSIGLSGQADQIASAARSGNCGAAINASAALIRDVQTLPVTVNPLLRSNLSQGAGTIARLALRECRQNATTTGNTNGNGNSNGNGNGNGNSGGIGPGNTTTSTPGGGG